MKLKLIYSIIISFVFYNSTFSQLKIVGNLYCGYQLIDLLKTKKLYQIDGLHYFWINSFINSVRNNHIDIEDKIILNHFSTQDINEILIPILKINNIDFNEKDLKNYLPNHLAPEIDNKKSDITYFVQENVKFHLYETALKVFNYTKDDILLLLGQTPSYLGSIIEQISKNKEEKISIFFIPFSGRPDTILPRLKTNQKWNWTQSSYKEILTKDRENFFRKLIEKKGFSPKIFNKKTLKKVYILDNSEGPALASFLNILCRWYKEEKEEMPNLYFLAMDKFNKPLDLKMNDDLKFEIDTIYLNMNDEILNKKLDQILDNLRLQPPFNAYLWQDGIENFIKQYPRPDAKKLLQIYLEYVNNKCN